MKNKLYRIVILALLIFTQWACTKEIEPIPASVSGISIVGIPRVGLPITFYPSSKNATSYKWTFGDNTSSTETTPTKIYNNSGNFEVVFKAIGSGGSVGDKSMVTIAPAVDFTITGGDCEAPCSITVTASNTVIGMEHIWSWGDNTTTTTTNPALPTTKLYSQANTYTVGLTVKAAGTTIGTVTKSVTIKPTSLRVTNAWSAGSILNDEGLHTATDKEGNVYVTGIYTGSCTFGPDASGRFTTLTPAVGNTPLFVAKYTSTGVLIWVNKYENFTFIQAPTPTGIVISNNNTLYISYNNNKSDGQNFGSGILKFSTISSGVPIWEKSFAEKDTKVNGIALDSDENIIIGGYFYSLFDKVKYDNTGSVGFVMKYRSNRDNYWTAPKYFGSGISSSSIEKVAVAKDNTIFYTGDFSGNNVAGSTTRGLVANTVNAAGTNTIIGKLDANGIPIWTKQDGIGNTNSSYYSYPRKVIVDNENNVWVLIRLLTGSDINFGTRILNNRSSADTFLAKYRNDGSIDFLNYASKVNYGVWDMNKDNDGNILLVTGSISITKLTNTGSVVYEDRALFSNNAYINTITSDINNNVFVTGTLYGPVTTSSGLTLNTRGVNDMFMLRYGK